MLHSFTLKNTIIVCAKVSCQYFKVCTFLVRVCLFGDINIDQFLYYFVSSILIIKNIWYWVTYMVSELWSSVYNGTLCNGLRGIRILPIIQFDHARHRFNRLKNMTLKSFLSSAIEALNLYWIISATNLMLAVVSWLIFWDNCLLLTLQDVGFH